MSGIPAGAGQLLGKRLGKFDILALLALGGTAEIYLARIGGAAGFEKYVVVKCLHDHLADDTEFVKMFLDEARLAAHLDHSNIVQTMELGQHEGRYYMVMEFLAGLSLAMIVRRAAERLVTQRIPVPLVLNVLAQSSAGLHYAHEKAMNGRSLGIVHRDISPQNLVVSFEGVVKIVDFGIAKAELRETQTKSGTIKGKFAYMSPEQCVANNVDRRTDVFALGVIAHELLTGRRLFKRQSAYETYQAVIHCDVAPPSTIAPDLDPALDPVIMRALTKDKADRYPTAEAFGDALLGYLHHRGIGSGPGDVSRFFDAHFAQELDEHSGRMRELISGRDISVDTGVSWGDVDLDDEPLGPLGAIGAVGDSGHNLSDLAAPAMPSRDELLARPPGQLSILIDELGAGSRVEDDDEMPAERTRIESNPLERINELERLAASAPPPRRRKSSGAMPRPATPMPQGSSPAAAVALSGLASGRFPDPANSPTMIAAADGPSGARAPLAGASPLGAADPAAGSPFANAPTSVDMPAATAAAFAGAASAFASAPTTLDAPAFEMPPAATSFANAPTAVPPPSRADQATLLAMTPPSTHAPYRPHSPPGGNANGGAAAPVWPPPLSPRPQMSSSVPPTHQAPVSQGYPVMNAQLSAQIATGATVFPSDPRGSQPIQPLGPPAGVRLAESSAQHEYSSPPGPPPGPTGQPGVPGSPVRPPDSGAMRPVAPIGHPGQLELLGQPGHGAPADPQRAASLMSPVGQQYPEVDWAAAAASRARAVPPWLLAVLFLGAIGLALALTILIARLVR